MNRIFLCLIVFAVTILFCRCTKESSGNESILYGTWIKGNNAGDTLRFFHRDGKNIMLYDYSFNPAFPVPTESEYKFINNKLSIRNYPVTSNEYYTLESFVWKQLGQEFEIWGNDLYLFLSSIQPNFIYRKI